MLSLAFVGDSMSGSATMKLEIRAYWIGALALAAVFAFQSPVTAQVAFASSADAEDVTYAADVADIIQNNCTVCHRPGGIGPMDLVTYEDARRYARRIREQAVSYTHLTLPTICSV